MKYLDKIIDSGKTIFTYDDIKLLLPLKNNNSAKKFLGRMVKDNIFIKIYKWIYWLKKFSEFELALKLKKNSYISFETVLVQEWIIYQDYFTTIFCASDNTIEKKVNEKIFSYKKLKDDVLYNPTWIINKWNYLVASKERAICDVLYLFADYYFDYLEDVDTDKLLEIAQIYNNKRLILSVKKLLKNAK